ncbi:MAG: sugar nucleotide-binding protein [Verrucomicrobiia bacterium]
MIAITGATGYVGQAFCRFFQSRSIPHTTIPSPIFRDPTLARSTLTQCRASFLINAAGYTGKPNVDACEFHKAECLEGNAVFPGRLATLCADLNLPWGHVSSGCIFTGDKGLTGHSSPETGTRLGFTELDPPNFSFRQNNCSFYSGTKALGEETLGYRETHLGSHLQWTAPGGPPPIYIWRLRIPFSHLDSPRNYLSKLLRYERLLNARNSISHLDEFVRACWECIDKQVPFGIYNITNPGSITTREIIDLIQASPLGPTLTARGKTFHFFENEHQFMEHAALTPRSNCVLDSSKLASVGIHLTPVRTALAAALENWTPSP